ncbi:TonB-dependent siderophore receptor [Ferrimonas balearica]|uniref:TonB-dependent siderophore receptor n=1 Tax=Ferrimonas balearica TaxID=44012 RepID=UPI001C9992E3|nr:TonB-dependent receptor [Ferrimonas balearica]MBY5920536.1 TonB-dependent receptor [Ferrimonas balearica]MBY5996779.1 TonB-dependent receptor [Ferrimonas balearica]
MMKLSPLFSAMLMAGLCAPASALAAESSEQSVDETLIVRGNSFDDYKVDNASGAMRGDIPLLDTPQSVTVIPEIVIDEQLATTLSRVLVNDASVTGGSQKWNREVFSLRGFELDSGSGYLRDGMQHWSHYVQPIEILERVEVLKGPSSMLYGQSNPGGLINMVTKKPTVERITDFGFDVDDNGSTRYQIDLGGALVDSGALRYRAVGVKQDTKEWREYTNGEERERDRWLGSLMVEGDIGQWGTLSVHYDKTSDKAGIDRGAILDANGDVIGDRDTIWDMPWAFIDNNIENYGANLNLYLSSNWEAKLGFNHQMYDRQRMDSLPGNHNVAEGTYVVEEYDRYDDWEFKTAYIDFTGLVQAMGMDHQVLFGANRLDYRYQRVMARGDKITVTNDGTNLPDAPVFAADDYTVYDASTYDYYGVYLQDLVTVNEHWQVLVGVRYDKLNDDANGDSDSLLPKVGLIYHPVDNASIYLNYSESFVPQGTVINEGPNGDEELNLDPEMGTQWELGYKWELFDQRLMLSGAVFDILKDNITITENVDGFDITTQGGEQRHRGLEMAAQGQVSDSWFLMASMMYLDANYETHDKYQDKTPIDAPEWTASLWSRYMMTEDLALNAGLFYEGDRFADADNTIVKDGYVRVDAGLSYGMKLANTELDFRLNVENLFDKEYLSGGSSTINDGIYNGDVAIGNGRTFRASVQVAF